MKIIKKMSGLSTSGQDFISRPPKYKTGVMTIELTFISP